MTLEFTEAGLLARDLYKDAEVRTHRSVGARVNCGDCDAVHTCVAWYATVVRPSNGASLEGIVVRVAHDTALALAALATELHRLERERPRGGVYTGD